MRTFEILLTLLSFVMLFQAQNAENLRRQPDLRALACWRDSFFLRGTDGKWF